MNIRIKFKRPIFPIRKVNRIKHCRQTIYCRRKYPTFVPSGELAGTLVKNVGEYENAAYEPPEMATATLAAAQYHPKAVMSSMHSEAQ